MVSGRRVDLERALLRRRRPVGPADARAELGDQPFARFVGPGDIIGTAADGEGALTVRSSAQVALLGPRFMGATRRWPALTAGLFARAFDQFERLTLERAICQQPKVETRLLGMLWQLADRCGG